MVDNFRAKSLADARCTLHEEQDGVELANVCTFLLPVVVQRFFAKRLN